MLASVVFMVDLRVTGIGGPPRFPSTVLLPAQSEYSFLTEVAGLVASEPHLYMVARSAV